MRSSNVFIALIVLAATGLLFLFGIAATAPLNPESADSQRMRTLTPLETPTTDFGNPQIGQTDAPVTIVEFGDYSCEPCVAVSADIATLVTEYAGKVRLVWKDFPNKALHPDAPISAEAARCAGIQGAYWEYHDLLLTNRGATGTENYLAFADTLELDKDAFRTCMDTRTTAPSVQRDFEEGLRLRVDATPYLFINERRVSGSLNRDQLKSLIDAALADKP